MDCLPTSQPSILLPLPFRIVNLPIPVTLAPYGLRDVSVLTRLGVTYRIIALPTSSKEGLVM